jgi:RNA polymerase sigma factor for flagellar operon FliA
MAQTAPANHVPEKPCPSTTQRDIDQLSNQELLQLYKETGDQQLRWALALRFTDLVKRVAVQATGLYNNFAQLDDIIQEGLLVLLNAVDKFDLSKNVKFETYISKRLRGMMVDLARRQDWLPRQVRQKTIHLNRAIDELSSQLGRAPQSREVADYMGLTMEQYDALLSDTAACSLVSFEAVLDACGSATEKFQIQGNPSNLPEAQFEEQELHEILAQNIASLRKNEQLVLSLYYEKELNMKEIAQVLGVSAARVSQIHSRALQRLRTCMKQYVES